jgi:hypothetical protein
MKKIFLLFVLIIISFNSISQETTAKKIAVISMYADKNIKPGSLSSYQMAFQRAFADTNYSLKKIMNEFKDRFYRELAPSFPLEFIDDKKYIATAEYKNLYNKISFSKDSTNLSRPYGYLAIQQTLLSSNDEVIYKSFEAIPGTDLVMLVSLDFEFVKSGMEVLGFGAAKVQSKINIKIYDKKLNKIFKLYEWATSSKELKYTPGGMFNINEVQPLIEDSVDRLMVDVKKLLPKKIEKMKDKI